MYVCVCVRVYIGRPPVISNANRRRQQSDSNAVMYFLVLINKIKFVLLTSFVKEEQKRHKLMFFIILQM